MQIFFYFFEFFLFFGDHDTRSPGYRETLNTGLSGYQDVGIPRYQKTRALGYKDTKCPSERDALPIHGEDRGVMEKGV